MRQDSSILNVDNEKIAINVTGMHCASCVATVEKSLRNTKGVSSVAVNLATEKAYVEFDPSIITKHDLGIVIENAGYGITGINEDTGNENASIDNITDKEEEKLKKARWRMFWSWAFTIPIVLWMIPMMVIGGLMHEMMSIYDIGMVILAFPVLFWLGLPTMRSAIKSALHRNANMDLLIALGTLSSYITGLAMIFGVSMANYAGISAMIMSFHLTGRYIEAKAKGRASQAIRKLLELGAKTAHVLVDDIEQDIPIEDIKINDIMIVRPGEKIPTDGEVIEGESTIDESMATGESMPIVKKIGDEVIGSTINQNGLLKIKATKIGKDTFLAQVIKMVEESQGSKVPIQEFADKVTSIFVPAVLIIAVLTFLAWIIFPEQMGTITSWASRFIPWVHSDLGAITSAIFATVAVLVIACPCALGLATPTALMVGSGMGAERGILIRDGSAIQIIKDIRTIVFDKTGTITKGKPEVTDILVSGDITQSDLLRIAGSIESGSEHPLGQAIIKKANESEIRLPSSRDFQSIPGKGVMGLLDGKVVTIGNLKLIEDIYGERNLPSWAENEIKRLEDEAKTVMIVARNGKFDGILAVADTLKDDSIQAIKELESMRIKTIMLTGDNKRTAEAIAKKVGISNVISDVLPDGKVSAIKELQNKFGLIAMVGDGINDAPALTQADVGIAIGTGTDIAIEASDVTLVSGNLSAVVSSIKLSQATFRKIKQNLTWAYGYNVLAIPLAILGLLHPVIAEIAMASSSVSVVTNANLLRKAKII